MLEEIIKVGAVGLVGYIIYRLGIHTKIIGWVDYLIDNKKQDQALFNKKRKFIRSLSKQRRINEEL